VLSGECVEGEHVGLGLFEQRGDLRQPGLELGDGVAKSRAGFVAVAGGEDLANDGAQRVVLVLAGMAAKVAEEVHGAALPRRAEHLRQRCLQAGVPVADGQLHPNQAARNEAAQELAPERLGLRGADVEADDFAPPSLVNGMRDHDALALHAP
jgi:hypothetical protein